MQQVWKVITVVLASVLVGFTAFGVFCLLIIPPATAWQWPEAMLMTGAAALSVAIGLVSLVAFFTDKPVPVSRLLDKLNVR